MLHFWTASDSQASFGAALRENGFRLTRGDRRGFVAVDAEGNVHSLSRWYGVKAKEVRPRFGEAAGLTTVDDAVSSVIADNTQNHTRASNEADKLNPQRLANHALKLSDMVDWQRQETQIFLEVQEERRFAEIAARQARLPTGLKAAWAQQTGPYERICQELAAEAQTCTARDQAEKQSLIDRHLSERRELDHELAFREAQNALEQELLDRQLAVWE